MRTFLKIEEISEFIELLNNEGYEDLQMKIIFEVNNKDIFRKLHENLYYGANYVEATSKEEDIEDVEELLLKWDNKEFYFRYIANDENN